MDATSILESELTRIGDRIKALEVQQDSLREARAAIGERQKHASAASGNTAASDAVEKTLALLRIEDEQTADHERSVEHHLQELRTRLDALAGDLEATQDSAVV